MGDEKGVLILPHTNNSPLLDLPIELNYNILKSGPCSIL